MGKWRKNSQKRENEQKILQKQENQDGKFFSQ